MKLFSLITFVAAQTENELTKCEKLDALGTECQANASCLDPAGVCICNNGFDTIDGNTCLPVGGAGTPCPSDCWVWDVSTQTCNIRTTENCFALKCEHNAMEIEFESRLFDVQDDAASTVFGEENVPEFNDGTNMWEMNCDLGTCGMSTTAEVVDSVNNLVFKIAVQKGQNSVALGDNQIFLNPVTASLTFTCQYPAELNVESDEFTIRGATATGETVNTGELGDGFSLTMYTDDAYSSKASNDNIFIGYPVYGKVAWSVTSVQSAVNFYIDECKVQHEAMEVFIIHDNCYSQSLGVKQNQEDKIVPNASLFQYTAFTIGSESQFNMVTTVSCSVKLCLVASQDCANALSTQDQDCDNIDEANYMYKANSFQ